MKEPFNMITRLKNSLYTNDFTQQGMPLVEIFGCTRVLIEHHSGVTQYDSDRICVKVKFGNMIVTGSGLELSMMSGERLVISGCIHGVTVERCSQ